MLAPTSGARFIGGLVFLEILVILEMLAILELLEKLEKLESLVQPREPEASEDAAEQKGSATLSNVCFRH